MKIFLQFLKVVGIFVLVVVLLVAAAFVIQLRKSVQGPSIENVLTLQGYSNTVIGQPLYGNYCPENSQIPYPFSAQKDGLTVTGIACYDQMRGTILFVWGR